jgi:hypothetical protein
VHIIGPIFYIETVLRGMRLVLETRVHMKLIIIKEFRAVNFAASKNLVVKSTMFPHLNIYKYTWTSSEGKTHSQIDDVVIDRRWLSSMLDVRSFRGANCDSDHYLVVAKDRERLAMGKLAVKKVDMDRFNLKKLNDRKLKIGIRLQ